MENRNDSARQSCTPWARQARATVAGLTFNRVASSRDDQCVTPGRFGGGVSVAVTIAR